ncbi:hypothetical protein G6F43_012382 [Rhizopus delemar]|nr:hypothetical protein G6F43_012382 [Rhizopus delemar]
MYDRMYETTRHKNIFSKYVPTDHKECLLQEMTIWMKSKNVLLTTDTQNLLESIDTSADYNLPTETPKTIPVSTSATLELDCLLEATSLQDLLPTSPVLSTNQDNTRDNKDNNEDSNNDSKWTFNGTNVTNLSRQYQHRTKAQIADKSSFQVESDLQEILVLSNILFLAPNQHSDLKVQVFGFQFVDSLCYATINRFMDNLEVDFSMQEVSDLAAIMDDVLTRKKLTIDVQLDLLLTAKTMDPAKVAVVRGIANLVVKLPTREIVDMDSLGETELQSTYIDPVLTPLLSNLQQNVILRWSNKNEGVSNICPDVVISTIIQSNALHGHH